MVVVIVVRLAGELSSRDNEPAASAAAGRFQLRPSALDRYASSLFKGDVLSVLRVIRKVCLLYWLLLFLIN